MQLQAYVYSPCIFNYGFFSRVDTEVTREKSLLSNSYAVAEAMASIIDEGVIATALCLFTLHFQPWLFLRRLDELLSRESSLVTSVSSLREKSHG